MLPLNEISPAAAPRTARPSAHPVLSAASAALQPAPRAMLADPKATKSQKRSWDAEPREAEEKEKIHVSTSYIYIYTYVHIDICIHTNAYKIHINMYVCMYVCMYVTYVCM